MTDSLNRKRQIIDSLQREAEQIMKRCQRGTRNYEEANNLHAACYAIIGKLLAQPKQEPNDIASILACRDMLDAQPLPQRTSVGLTDKERHDLYEAHHDKYNIPKGSPDGMDYERAIEAKVRADEREACAKVCDDIDTEYQGEDVLATWCAKAIRARGEQA